MFPFAFARGQGPAYADLPPTLQPCAIAASAPPSEYRLAATLSALVYLLIGGAALTLASPAPATILQVSRPTKPERVIEFAGPLMPRFIEHRLLTSGGSGGGPALPTARAVAAPRVDPEVPAASLPTENHRGDLPVAGPGRADPLVQANGSTQPMGMTSPGIRDFTMIGLTELRRVEPLYPDFARRARIQGSVVLSMTVDDQGLPIQVQVLEGPQALHEAALQAARQWRFEPARIDGRSVAARFKLTLNFRLR
jgi:protein TonB